MLWAATRTNCPNLFDEINMKAKKISAWTPSRSYKVGEVVKVPKGRMRLSWMGDTVSDGRGMRTRSWSPGKGWSRWRTVKA